MGGPVGLLALGWTGAGAFRGACCGPQNKTSRPFTKPVGQLIDAWKHVRPPQPKIVDRKTGEHREFLFCVRGAQIGRAYLNDTVLPALCRKAGIPESDSRGALTSHRARSTIATQLLNAPEPLSLADLKEWLGHKHFFSTRHYAAILQRRLTAAPKESSAGRLLEVKDGIDQMLERLTLTDDERVALEGDREALAALAERLAKVPTPAGPTQSSSALTERSSHSPPCKTASLGGRNGQHGADQQPP